MEKDFNNLLKRRELMRNPDKAFEKELKTIQKALHKSSMF